MSEMDDEPSAPGSGDLLAEVLTTLEHARKFVTTREKMHPEGVKLYDETTCEVITALYAARALGDKADGVGGDGCDASPVPSTECNCLPWPDKVEQVARAIEATMFAPHELPLDAELHAKYRNTAAAAIKAMDQWRFEAAGITGAVGGSPK